MRSHGLKMLSDADKIIMKFEPECDPIFHSEWLYWDSQIIIIFSSGDEIGDREALEVLSFLLGSMT